MGKNAHPKNADMAILILSDNVDFKVSSMEMKKVIPWW